MSIERGENFTVNFKKLTDSLVVKQNTGIVDTIDYFRRFIYGRRDARKYTPEEVEKIVAGGSLEEQRNLSRTFFVTDGFYRRILVYYATLLKYVGILVPHPSFGQRLSTPHIKKKYFNAQSYIDRINLPEKLTAITLRVLVDGAYYGIAVQVDKEKFILLDLPTAYCRSRFKDLEGNDIIEFNIEYFLTFDETLREHILASYPKKIRDYYNRYMKSKNNLDSWYIIDGEHSVYFSLYEDTMPPFLPIIPATLQYDAAVDTEAERAVDEIRKILVQKIPHLNDGTLLFEPQEAEVMHNGAVQMLSGNKTVSVLTTYADVDAVTSKTSNDTVTAFLENMVQNIYAKTGTSQELFSPRGAEALQLCIANDMAMMMILGNKYSRFLTKIIDQVFGNSNVSFTYNILPVSYYNQADYITDAFKLAQSGYSFLVPCAALGISQSALMDLKELENEVLDLDNVLIPLQSTYTQSYRRDQTPEKETEPETKPTEEEDEEKGSEEVANNETQQTK